jgi:hypothetical protein
MRDDARKTFRRDVSPLTCALTAGGYVPACVRCLIAHF